MRKIIIEKLAALITAAFGLVAALAWNDAIKTLFIGPCGTENAGPLCSISSTGPWFYALFVTIIAVLATIWIGKIQTNKTDEKEKSELNKSLKQTNKKTKQKSKKQMK